MINYHLVVFTFSSRHGNYSRRVSLYEENEFFVKGKIKFCLSLHLRVKHETLAIV